MTHFRHVAPLLLICLFVLAVPAGADVVLPKRLLVLDQQVTALSTHTEGDLPPLWISHTTIGLSNLDTSFWFRASVSAGLDGLDGDRTLLDMHAEAGWTWGKMRGFRVSRFQASLRGSGALGAEPLLAHPQRPRYLGAGRFELALPVRFVHELMTDEKRIHGLSLLFDLEPSLRTGGPRAPGFNVQARAGIAYLFPKILELQFHTNADFATREETTWRVGLQPEMWMHLCGSRAPRLRRSLVHDPANICRVSIVLWGWFEPLVDGLKRVPWGAGLRLVARFNLY